MGGLFFLFWIILNGRVTTEILCFGIAISLSLYLFSWKYLGYSLRHEKILFRNLPFIVTFLLVLIKEVFVSTIVMAGFIFNVKYLPEPVIVYFSTPIRSRFLQVILANSISLTPGTITLRLRDGEFQVHCYDKTMARGINDSTLVRLLSKMEESF